jgi:hypothetical protein
MDNSQFLNLLAHLESSGGKRRVHPIVKTGVQEGTRAVSSFGTMPNTLWEMAQRNKKFQATPIGQEILKTGGDPEAINQITAVPHKDEAATIALKEEEEQRLKPYLTAEVDPTDAMLYAHRRGVPGAVAALQKKEPLENDPYVQAGKKLMAPAEEDEAKKMKMQILQSVLDAAKRR